MRQLMTVILWISLSFLVLSCGQKGALYLPASNALENDVLADKKVVGKNLPEDNSTDNKTRESDTDPHANQAGNNNLY